jgi:hypothetical protein
MFPNKTVHHANSNTNPTKYNNIIILHPTSIKGCWNKWKRSFSIHCSCISISYTSAALTPEQEADLMAYYVNLHSSTFTAGEIGQLVRELQQVLILGRLLIRHFYLGTMLLI